MRRENEFVAPWHILILSEWEFEKKKASVDVLNSSSHARLWAAGVESGVSGPNFSKRDQWMQKLPSEQSRNGNIQQ